MGYIFWEGLKVVGGSEIWFACLLNASLFSLGISHRDVASGQAQDKMEELGEIAEEREAT